MKQFSRVLIWWLLVTIVWGLYRLLNLPEFISELIAKPVIWLGITWLCFRLQVIPNQVLTELKSNFSARKPILTTFIVPTVFIILYFLLINFRLLANSWPSLAALTLPTIILAVVINFATGIVEEITYRGVLYVWLLQSKNEALAFVIVQILFLLAHVPTLLLHSSSLSNGLTHAFFIVLIGSIHTLVFRFTKSIYASSLTHGIRNTLVKIVLLK